jgi:deazaflavin-dependent oxidoreductase (nitroreductase family)
MLCGTDCFDTRKSLVCDPNNSTIERISVPDHKGTLPRWLRPANHVVRTVSRLGIPLGTIQVLTVPGRRSGTPRSTPVSPLTVNGCRYVVAALPDSDWARNVRAAGHADLSRGRRRVSVTLAEVIDPGLKEEVMRAFPREVPGGVPMFVRPGGGVRNPHQPPIDPLKQRWSRPRAPATPRPAAILASAGHGTARRDCLGPDRGSHGGILGMTSRRHALSA